MRKLLLGIAIVALAGATFAWGEFVGSRKAQHIPYTKAPEMVLALNQSELGCRAVASVNLFENSMEETVLVDAGRGTDTVAIRIDAAAKELHIISGADVRIGRAAAEVMTIILDTDRHIVAVQIIPHAAHDVYTFRLDKKKSNAVWGKMGLSLGGLMGWAHYLECR